ncbi:hypothetical protein D3C77_429240 [compost metagenome]
MLRQRVQPAVPQAIQLDGQLSVSEKRLYNLPFQSLFGHFCLQQLFNPRVDREQIPFIVNLIQALNPIDTAQRTGQFLRDQSSRSTAWILVAFIFHHKVA